MSLRKFYNRYHKYSSGSNKIISSSNFTYFNAIQVINKHIARGSNVLDIGCGVGTLTFYVASLGINVLGIDISNKAIISANKTKKILKLNKNVDFKISDFMELDLNKKFDTVYMFEVLEHLVDDKKAVTKIRNLLKINGLFIMSSPSLNAPLYKLGLLSKFDKDVGHVRRYTQKRLKKLIESLGFEVIETKITEGLLRNALYTNKIGGFILKFIRGPISILVAYLDKLFVYILGESQIYIVARKK